MALNAHRIHTNSPRLWGWLVFILSTLYCLWYGRIGISSLDSSIVFDGGWRLLQGEAIARDFFTPNGLVPMAIQALFFKVFGVSWFSFCLHAALFNGMFALIVFHWLRQLKASLPLATCYALLSGMVFYPPFGTPFMDQHAFFFVLLLLFAAQSAPRLTGRPQKLVYLSIVPIFLLAFYSKQVPTLFALPVLPLIWWTEKAEKNRFKNTIFILGGLLLSAVAWSLIFQPWSLNWDNWWHFQWKLPAQTGLHRISNQSLFSIERLLTSLVYLPRTVFQPLNGTLTALAYLLPGLLLFWQMVGTRNNRFGGLSYLLQAWALLFVTGWHVRVTLNQEANSLAFFFLALACVHLYLHNWWVNHSDRFSSWLLKLQIPLLLAWALTVGASAVVFHEEVVVERTVHDFALGEAPEARMPKSLKGLDFIVYSVPGRGNWVNPPALLRFLDANPGNFFFLGDQSFFYGLSGRSSPTPSVWFHAGLTYPRPGTWRKKYDMWLLGNLIKSNPKYMIAMDANHSIARGKRTDFPLSWAWIQERAKTCFLEGGYDIIELETSHPSTPSSPF